MALDTTVQPFISQMLRQPSAESAKGVTEALGNFAAGFVEAREEKRAKEQAAYDRDPEGEPMPSEPSKPERFMKSFSEFQNPQRNMRALQERSLKAHVIKAEAENRSMNQFMAINPIEFAQKAGDVPVEQIPEFVQKNAALAATPWGKPVLSMMMQAYEASSVSKIQAAQAKFMNDLSIEMIGSGLDPKDELQRSEFLQQRMADQAMERRAKYTTDFLRTAEQMGKDVSGLPIPQDAFNQRGFLVKPEVFQEILGKAPRSQRLQSLDERAAERLALQREISDLKYEMFQQSEENKNIRNQANIEARKALEEGLVSREQWVNRQTQGILDAIKRNPKTENMDPTRMYQLATEIAGKAWDEQLNAKRPAPANAAPQQQPAMIEEVVTVFKGDKELKGPKSKLDAFLKSPAGQGFQVREKK